MQRARRRGATGAATGCRGCTQTVLRTSREPSAAPARGREALPSAGGPASGGGSAGEFFGALGPAWRLTETQRARLTPAVLAALDGGWSPQGLAGFAGSNTDGVRNPYAVLAARLSVAELPPPSGQLSPRPPWCGECDERTRRHEGADGVDAGRCPACHPLASLIGPSSSPAGQSPASTTTVPNERQPTLGMARPEVWDLKAEVVQYQPGDLGRLCWRGSDKCS